TSKDGNHNTGHEFNTGYKPWTEGDPPAHGLIGPLLSPEDRLAIIEHLKVRNDDLDGPQQPWVPSSSQCNVPTRRAVSDSLYVRYASPRPPSGQGRRFCSPRSLCPSRPCDPIPAAGDTRPRSPPGSATSGPE